MAKKKKPEEQHPNAIRCEVKDATGQCPQVFVPGHGGIKWFTIRTPTGQKKIPLCSMHYMRARRSDDGDPGPVGRPTAGSDRTERLQLSLPPELKARVVKLADKRGIPVSQLGEEAFEKLLA